jgi:hypothetical protein
MKPLVRPPTDRCYPPFPRDCFGPTAISLRSSMRILLLPWRGNDSGESIETG